MSTKVFNGREVFLANCYVSVQFQPNCFFFRCLFEKVERGRVDFTDFTSCRIDHVFTFLKKVFCRSRVL